MKQMTWMQLDCDWGLPCVNIKLARRFLAKLHVVPLLQDLQEDARSCQQREAWLAQYCRSDYEGMQLIALHLDIYTDTLVLTVMHPQFPRSRPGQQLPEWAVIVHEADTAHAYCTLEAWEGMGRH